MAISLQFLQQFIRVSAYDERIILRIDLIEFGNELLLRLQPFTNFVHLLKRSFKLLVEFLLFLEQVQLIRLLIVYH